MTQSKTRPGSPGPIRALTMVIAIAVAPVVLSVAPVALIGSSQAQELSGGTLRVAIRNDMANYDPQELLTVNLFLPKNLYDGLIEYTGEGEPVPSLATGWQIAPDNRSVTISLRDDVRFHSGAPFTSADVAATLEKAADPARGKQVHAGMGMVESWTADDDHTVTITFRQAAPDRQILDLLQNIQPIEATGIETVETVPAGTGAFMLEDRVVGQSITLVANPDYWRDDEPVAERLEFTVFSDDAAAYATLESGGVDLIYGGSARGAVRLRDAGFQIFSGPGKVVQVLRINTTLGPFQNEQFRQAFNYLVDRENILRLGYAGLGEVTALPWAPANPAYDASYNETYAFDLDRARELIEASGLSESELEDWTLLTNAGSEAAVMISQILQGTLSELGIDIQLDLRDGAEYTDALLSGNFNAIFAEVGNTQKFPSRIATNSIYRVANNPVLGDPHPHPDYVAAIEGVNGAFGTDVQAAYDELNRQLVESSFAIPTHSYEVGLLVAAPNVGGFTPDIDNLFVARTLGFK